MGRELFGASRCRRCAVDGHECWILDYSQTHARVRNNPVPRTCARCRYFPARGGCSFDGDGGAGGEKGGPGPRRRDNRRGDVRRSSQTAGQAAVLLSR